MEWNYFYVCQESERIFLLKYWQGIWTDYFYQNSEEESVGTISTKIELMSLKGITPLECPPPPECPNSALRIKKGKCTIILQYHKLEPNSWIFKPRSTSIPCICWHGYFYAVSLLTGGIFHHRGDMSVHKSWRRNHLNSSVAKVAHTTYPRGNNPRWNLRRNNCHVSTGVNLLRE